MGICIRGSTGRLGSEVALELGRRQLPWKALPGEQHPLPDAQGHEVWLDVSLPHGTEQLALHLLSAPQRPKALLVGTTGHRPECLCLLETLSQQVPLFLVSNFSAGVYLFTQLLQALTPAQHSVAELAQLLGFSSWLHESHHDLKKDAPSGTAKTLAEAARIPPEKISSARVGQVFGEHEILLSAPSETLRIRHEAQSRALFAKGAVDMAEALFHSQDLQKGLYTAADAWQKVLNSRIFRKATAHESPRS